MTAVTGAFLLSKMEKEAIKMPLNLNYYYGDEAEQYSFYRVPKLLFTDLRYGGVSVEAKVLYGLLLDRMSLSFKNGWCDGDGKVFIYFTLEDAVTLIGCGKDKVIKLFKELDIENGIGLIERKKQGQGRPTKIYVKNFTLPPQPNQSPEKPKSTSSSNAEVKTSGKPKSAPRKSRSLDFGKTDSNNTDKNKTDLSDTNLSINPGQGQLDDVENSINVEQPMDRMDVMDLYRKLIKENIAYDILLHDNPYEQECLDGFVELITETVCSNKKTIRINQEDMPTDIVKSRFLKLDSEHIRYVMECLNKNTTKVGNIRAYTLSALFNASVTIGPYYTNLVNHDMAQGFNSC